MSITNPIYRKRRYDKLKPTDKAWVKLPGDEWDGKLVQVIKGPFFRETLGDECYLVKFMDDDRVYRAEELDAAYMTENPIYSKRRAPPRKFKLGDRVVFFYPASKETASGTVSRVHTLRKDVNRYDVDVAPDRKFFGVEEPDMRFAKNPIYPKKRSNTLFQVGEVVRLKYNTLVTMHGEIPPRTIGIVREVAQFDTKTIYKVEFENHEGAHGVQEERLEKVVYEENPIYPKERGEGLHLHDKVLVTGGKFEGKSGTIVAINPVIGMMTAETYTTVKFDIDGTLAYVHKKFLRKIGYGENPIFPKRRSMFSVSQKVFVRSPLDKKRWGKQGTVVEIKHYQGIEPRLFREHGEASRDPIMVRVNFPGIGTDWFWEGDIKNETMMRFEKNPIYGKRRYKLLDVGDRALIIKVNSQKPEDAEIRQRIGTSGIVKSRRGVVGSWIYEIQFQSGFIGSYYHDEIEMVGFTNNPVYKKRRYVSKFKIGDRVTTTNLAGGRNKTGIVFNIHGPDNISDEHSYDVKLPHGAWSQYYESSLMLAAEENPIYPKRRTHSEIKVGDQVTVTDGHAAGSSGEVISTSMPPMPGYITIRAVNGSVYAVKMTHIVKTWPRYQNNQPRRWGVWPAEDPPVGEVVIDSHPTSERHGTTATVVKRGKSTTGESIYLLKFPDRFERWYTSLQIRRMPSKLGWRSMQENPIFPKRRQPPGSLREKLIDGRITFRYMPRTGQIRMLDKIPNPDSLTGIRFELLYAWDDPPGDLGEWLSYLERASETGREKVVDKVIEQLKKHLPADVFARVSP